MFSEIWKGRVFRDCIIMDRSCSVIFADDFVKFIASTKSFSNIDIDRDFLRQYLQMMTAYCY